MKNLLQSLALILLVLGLTNCSSTIFSVVPDEESKLELGRKMLEKDTDQVFSSISFEDFSESEFIFYLYVYNKSEKELMLDPKLIYFKIYDEKKKLISHQKFYAYNPEELIDNINMEIDDRETENDVSTGLNIVFALFDTIVDLSDDEDDNVDEVLENVVIFTGNQVNEEADYDNDLDFLNYQKSFWKNEVLRISELNEDEDVGGNFLIPILEGAKYLKLYIPLGETIHTYKFRQIAE